MKKLIAVVFALSLLFVIASPAFSHSVEKSQLAKVYKPEMVYINDALTLDVSPKYVSFVKIHAANDFIKSVALEVRPKNNSPPYNRITGAN